jgi:hypothetical protein
MMPEQQSEIFRLMKLKIGLLALVCSAYLSPMTSAMAITVELAEKCSALTNKAFPWRVPDNPSTGREHGSPKQARDYYNNCVAKNGSIEEGLRESESHSRTPKRGDVEGQSLPRPRTFPDGLL